MPYGIAQTRNIELISGWNVEHVSVEWVLKAYAICSQQLEILFPTIFPRSETLEILRFTARVARKDNFLS